MSRGLFQDMLVKLYDSNPAYKVDVVQEKRKKFYDSLNEANEALRGKDYLRAVELYKPLVILFSKDVYSSEELKFDRESIYYMKCCYAYCLMEARMGVIDDFDIFLNIVLGDLLASDRKELLPLMILLQVDLTEERWYSATQQYVAMKMMAQTHSPDQEPSEAKKMFKELLPSDDKIMKESEDIFESFMNKLVKYEEMRTKTQGMQTDKTKMNTKSTQTDKPKRKNAEIQVEIDHPQITLLQEIKTRLEKDQEKTSKSLSTLHSKVNDINSKLVKEYGNITTTFKRDCDRRCERNDAETERLKEEIKELERGKEWDMNKLAEMQKMLLNLINEKYNLQVNDCKYLIRKCDFMVNYLSNLIKHLTLTSIPTVNSVKQDIQFWQNQHTTTDTYLTGLNQLFQEVMSDFIQVGDSNKLKNWPDPIQFPREENLVFLSFIPAIQNIVESENKLSQALAYWSNSHYSNPKNGVPLYKDAYMMNSVPQVASIRMLNYAENAYSIHPQYLACGMAPNAAMPQRFRPPTMYGPVAPAGPYMPGPTMPAPITGSNLPGPFAGLSLPGLVTGTTMPVGSPSIPRSVSSPGISGSGSVQNMSGSVSVPNIRPNRLNSSSPSNSSADDVGEASGYNSSLLHILYTDSETNEIVTEEMLLKFLSENLPTVPEADLLIAMLAALEKHEGTFIEVHKRTVLKDVIEILRSKSFETFNKQIESSCTICFEEMKQDQMYNLTCKHKYHKKCIKTWLKKNSNCPICRTAATLND